MNILSVRYVPIESTEDCTVCTDRLTDPVAHGDIQNPAIKVHAVCMECIRKWVRMPLTPDANGNTPRPSCHQCRAPIELDSILTSGEIEQLETTRGNINVPNHAPQVLLDAVADLLDVPQLEELLEAMVELSAASRRTVRNPSISNPRATPPSTFPEFIQELRAETMRMRDQQGLEQRRAETMRMPDQQRLEQVERRIDQQRHRMSDQRFREQMQRSTDQLINRLAQGSVRVHPNGNGAMDTMRPVDRAMNPLIRRNVEATISPTQESGAPIAQPVQVASPMMPERILPQPSRPLLLPRENRPLPFIGTNLQEWLQLTRLQGEPLLPKEIQFVALAVLVGALGGGLITALSTGANTQNADIYTGSGVGGLLGSTFSVWTMAVKRIVVGNDGLNLKAAIEQGASVAIITAVFIGMIIGPIFLPNEDDSLYSHSNLGERVVVAHIKNALMKVFVGSMGMGLAASGGSLIGGAAGLTTSMAYDAVKTTVSIISRVGTAAGWIFGRRAHND